MNDATRSGEHPRATPYLTRRADHRSPADRAFILRILGEYVTHERTGDDAEARYRWLYRDNPHGEALTFLALDPSSSEPVGITSIFPRKTIVAGHEITGAIGGDGYVTPAHRRRGIVTALHREAMEAMRDGEVAFMFGPPEPNNLKALVKAGARVTGAVQRFTRPLTARGLGRLSGHAGPLTPLLDFVLKPRSSRLRAVPLGDRPDPRVDRLFEEMLAERRHAVTPVRDAAFYAWRFAASPSRVEHAFLLLDRDAPRAVVAVERSLGAAALIDVVAPLRRRLAAHAAVAHLCRGDDTLHVQVHVPAPRERALLVASGFLPRSTKAFQVQVPEDHPQAATLTRPDAWQYMWGDGDVDHVL